MVSFYLLGVMWGFRSAYYWERSLLDLLIPVATAFVMCWWAISDSIARGQPIPVLSRAWFLFAAGILVPCYVVWTRGWPGVGLVLFHSIAWYVVCVLGSISARYFLTGEF